MGKWFDYTAGIVLLVYNVISLESFQSVNEEMASMGRKTIEMYQSLMERELDRISIDIADK